ncbi:MAG TPA: SDR family oxidoreductase [Thermoanaerobaculia bacterium]|jgi:NAD(P)-dependent dehydrogenase (short-subunit alcohol dehydrogenase family)
MQTIAITGGNGGLGTAVVERLSRDYRCVVLDRAQMDVTNEESVRRAFSNLGDLYAVVHLVGGFAAGSLADTTSETWSRMLDLNLTAAFLTMREALPRLTRPGRIVAVSSIATLTASGGTVAYSVSKSALNALVQSVAAEHRGSGLTINAVLPDAMATPAMLKEMDRSQLVPLERVVETIAFLLSDAAAGITGTLIPIRK